MSVTVRLADNNKSVTIKLNDRFDFSVHNDFRNAYKDVALLKGEYQVDLSHTSYLDSSALGMLLLLKEHADAQLSSVRLVGFNDEVREILNIASFNKLFQMG